MRAARRRARGSPDPAPGAAGLSALAEALAHVELGHLALAGGGSGAPEHAREHFAAALQLTRRSRHPAGCGIRGRAAEGMFRLAVAEDDRRAAERWARVALRALGTVIPLLFEAAHHVAERFVEDGNYPVAIHLLRRARHGRADPADRIRTVTLLVRAAALAERRATLRRAWREARALIRRHSPQEQAARQLLDLAEAGAGRVPPDACRAVLKAARKRAEACGQDALAREAAERLTGGGVTDGGSA